MNKSKGITLIALVVTIVVLLILAGTSIAMLAGENGIITQAQDAKEETEVSEEKEIILLAYNGALTENLGKGVTETDLKNALKANGYNEDDVTVIQDGENIKVTFIETQNVYTVSSNKVIDGPIANGPSDSIKPGETVSITQKNNYTDKEGNTATVPKGFKVSEVATEQNVSTGLVIKDVNNNEFVWIPIDEELAITTDVFTTSYDNQSQLNDLYGENYYNYEANFKYEEEYSQMIAQVNEYDGFYIGRYETTIDTDGKIGSKYNKEVLTPSHKLITENGEKSYRWFGLYYEQKNADVTGNGTDIQTAMIYDILWERTMSFIRTQKGLGKTQYDVDTVTPEWHNGWEQKNSAQANAGDVALNIWDLESNTVEASQGIYDDYRLGLGGACADYALVESAASGVFWLWPNEEGAWISEPGSGSNSIDIPTGSRLVLYIK